MKNIFSVFTLIVAGVVVIFSSCAGLSSRKTPPESGIGASIPDRGIPERILSAEHIMGEGIISTERLAAFLLHFNSEIDADFVHELSNLYIEEAAIEGVNHDTAFAQMCLETGFLRYGGLVTPDMNNFCGLGAIGPEQPGLFFPDPRTGVRAHIQHLQAYADTEPLNQDLVDPRYRYVKRGSAPTIQGLSGTWAADKSYDVKIIRILGNLYEFSL
jgi:hypothetical protein